METNCSSCGRRIRIGDEHAGKPARCPHCQNIFQVPFASTPALAADTPPSSEAVRWICRGVDQAIYGPVSKTELDGWVSEGRLNSDTVIAPEGTTDWRSAAELYPQLKSPFATPGRDPTPARTSPANPFAPAPANPFAASANPYATPRAQLGTSLVSPHRGPLLLTLGVLSIVCCSCLGPIAWIMAAKDLREMQQGTKDPTGRGLTQAGLILGIIGSVIVLLTGLVNALVVVAGIAR